MNKSIALKQFNEQYSVLKESEKTNFSRITNKLLQVNYITARKDGDGNDYRFIIAYKALFEGFLWLIDFDIYIKREDEVIYIVNENSFNHLRLRKLESVLLLVIRILYQRKKDLVTIGEDVEVFLYEIHNELSRIGFLDNKRVTKDKLQPALTLFKGYNIIDYIDKGLHDDCRIKIYPSIVYVTNLESIKDIVARLEDYIEGAGNEETDENQTY